MIFLLHFSFNLGSASSARTEGSLSEWLTDRTFINLAVNVSLKSPRMKTVMFAMKGHVDNACALKNNFVILPHLRKIPS